MRKTFIAALVLLFVAWGAPASAAPGCGANSLCFHNTSTSNPNHWRDGADWGPGECYNLPANSNNTTSYITNRTNGVWYVYTSGSCLDWAGTIYANSSGPMTGSWNNSISSYRHS